MWLHNDISTSSIESRHDLVFWIKHRQSLDPSSYTFGTSTFEPLIMFQETVTHTVMSNGLKAEEVAFEILLPLNDV